MEKEVGNGENRTQVIGRALVMTLPAIAFIFFFISRDFVSAFYAGSILVFMVIPPLLKKRYQFYIPYELDLGICIFVFLTIFLGTINKFYDKFPMWDGILHFQSGLLLGLLGFVLIYSLNEQKEKKIQLVPGFVSFFAFNFSLSFGALWEIYEFFGDKLLGYHMQESGLPDTMGDLIVNALGALIVSALGYWWMRLNLRLPFTSKKLEKS